MYLGAAARSLYVVPPHADIDNGGQALSISYRLPRACVSLVECHIGTMRGSHVVFALWIVTPVIAVQRRMGVMLGGEM